MRMRKILSGILVMVLLASGVLLAVMPAAAQQAGIPFAGEDNELTKDELSSAICSYMLDEGGLSDDIGDASYVYAYWEGKPKTIVDMTDRTVTLYRPPEIIVPMSQGLIDQTMVAFGIEDRIVGYSSCGKIMDCDTSGYLAINDTTDPYKGSWHIGSIIYPKVIELPWVGKIDAGINYESVATLCPDLVIIRVTCCQSEENVERTAKVIESLGIPVVIIKDPRNYDKPGEGIIYEEIKVLGVVFGKQKEAQKLINYLDGWIVFIRERTKDIPEDEKPRVLYFGAAKGDREKGGVGNVRGVDTCESVFLENIVNAKNAYRGTGRVIMSAEQVLALNPDVIVLPTSSGFHPPRELYEGEAFENIREVKAIKERRVGSLPAVGCRSERLDFAMTLMIEAKIIYPERFEDVDLNEFVDEYYKNVFGVSDDQVEKLKLTQRLRWLEIIE